MLHYFIKSPFYEVQEMENKILCLNISPEENKRVQKSNILTTKFYFQKRNLFLFIAVK